MQKDEVERAMHVFPALPNPPQLSWHDNTLTIAPDTAWDSGRTYIVTLQGNAKDRHNNRLTQSLQLAFSTGDRIDSGAITGQIVRDGRPARNVLALCYKLDTTDVNPELDTADYVVQTDTAGEFSFRFLSDATYRVFGLEDKDNDWLWTIGAEAVAVAAHDAIVTATAGAAPIPPLPLTLVDSARSALVDCQALAPRILRLELDRRFDSADIGELVVHVVSSEQSDSPVRIYMTDSSATKVFTEFSDNIAPGKWNLMVRSRVGAEDTCVLDVPDVWNRPFPGELRIVPDAANRPPDGLRIVSIYLSEPASGVAADSVLFVAGSDTSRAETTLVNPFLLQFGVPESVRFAGPVELDVPIGYVHGVNGGRWPSDSAFTFRFASPFADSTGEFELSVSAPPLREPLPLRVVLSAVSPGASDVRYDIDTSGVVMGKLTAGDYTISLWGDRDRDEHRDLGWPYPFRRSEPVWRYADTLQVRARFTTELTLPPIGKK
jgi:hypothetical protein